MGQYSCSNYEEKRSCKDLFAAAKNYPQAYTGLKQPRLNRVKYEIRQILYKKDELFKQFINNGKLQSDYERLECIRSDLVEFIMFSKEQFHLRLPAKLSDPSTSAKTYWSILKTFVIGKKAPLILP